MNHVLHVRWDRQFRNVARIRAVILDGRLYDRTLLDRLLADAVAKAAVE
jgi:hypothetical protein